MQLLETKFIVSGLTFVTVAYKRDVQCAAFLLAALSNALLGKILKRIINASRPVGAQLSDPGMPSSHALSLFFFAGYLASGALVWPTLPVEGDPLRWTLASALVLTAGALTYLRVQAGLHTISQCAVGACIGFINGTAAFYASPALEQRLSAFADGDSSGLLVALVLAGALIVGSVERVLAARLKRKTT